MPKENAAKTLSEIFFTLLRLEICKDVKFDFPQHLSEGMLAQLYRIASAHDLSHVISSALHKCGLLGKDEASLKFQSKQLHSVYRLEQLKYAFDDICSVFEEAQIPYMPLKGSVLRAYYPEEWMRTSCDIDILVHEADIGRAIDSLVGKSGWKTDNKREYHDVSLYSKSGIHLELHFSIKENIDSIDALLSKVWEHSVRTNESCFRYELTKEYFVFYHIAHMSYHFISGGCGIKPFVDLYVMKTVMGYDDFIVRDYLRLSGLEKFYDNVLCVTDVWFGEKAHTPLSLQIEEYILKGGVYGSLENRVVLAQSKKGGKAKYILSRIFAPYDTLKNYYPVIKKHKWLFPFMQVGRWFRFLKKGKLKRGLMEVKVSNSVSKNKAADVDAFLNSIGL